MAKQPQYIPIASAAFNAYLDNEIDLDELIKRLRDIELQVLSDEEEEEESEGKLWFRFFADDPLQTTISEIEQDLHDPAHPSSQILLRGIAYGLDANELEVHFS